MKRTALIFAAMLLAPLASLNAQLGLTRETYGVWDRGGNNTVAAYPFTRGQAYANTWQNVNSARHTFDWSGLDVQLQFADSQNESLNIQILPFDGGPNGVPPWILAANGGGVPQYTDGILLFWDYGDPIPAAASSNIRNFRATLFGWTNAGGNGVGTDSLAHRLLHVTNRVESNLKAQQFIRLVFGKDQT